MSTSVKYFTWNMPGAPTLNRDAGSLIAVLDACLVVGFGLRTVSTLTASGGAATATTALNHGYEVDTVISISNASPAGFNGDFRITAVTDTTFTFATAQPDGSASGAIMARIAPLGWVRPFTGTNIAVYRSADVESTRMFLSVQDTNVIAGNARARGFENMTGPSTGTNGFPLNTQAHGGGFVYKANSVSPSEARPWFVIGDSKTFYIWHSNLPQSQAGTMRGGQIDGFGDFLPRNSSFAFNCFASFAPQNPESTGVSDIRLAGPSHTSFLARGSSGFAGSAPAFFRGIHPAGASSSSGNGGIFFPNPADNALILCPVAIFTDSAQTWIGEARGLLWIVNTIPNFSTIDTFAGAQKIQGVGPLAGKKYICAKDGGLAHASHEGCMFDLLGPWS